MRGPAESLRARMLFLDAGMYTAASWQSPQLLTGKLCRFCVILRSDACLDNALILLFVVLILVFSPAEHVAGIFDSLRAGGKTSLDENPVKLREITVKAT